MNNSLRNTGKKRKKKNKRKKKKREKGKGIRVFHLALTFFRFGRFYVN